MPAWLDSWLPRRWLPRRWLPRRWLRRHQHPVSLLLHAVGIPMLPLAGVIVVLQLLDGAWGLWWRPVGLVGLSYALQWMGHRIEGNDMGEVVLIKRMLGRPYVAISPRYRRAVPPLPKQESPGTLP